MRLYRDLIGAALILAALACIATAAFLAGWSTITVLLVVGVALVTAGLIVARYDPEQTPDQTDPAQHTEDPAGGRAEQDHRN